MIWNQPPIESWPEHCILLTCREMESCFLTFGGAAGDE